MVSPYAATLLLGAIALLRSYISLLLDRIYVPHRATIAVVGVNSRNRAQECERAHHDETAIGRANDLSVVRWSQFNELGRVL